MPLMSSGGQVEVDVVRDHCCTGLHDLVDGEPRLPSSLRLPPRGQHRALGIRGEQVDVGVIRPPQSSHCCGEMHRDLLGLVTDKGIGETKFDPLKAEFRCSGVGCFAENMMMMMNKDECW